MNAFWKVIIARINSTIIFRLIQLVLNGKEPSSTCYIISPSPSTIHTCIIWLLEGIFKAIILILFIANLITNFDWISFGDISSATILGDVRLLSAGICVVFIYVQLMLGKFNLVEQRVRDLDELLCRWIFALICILLSGFSFLNWNSFCCHGHLSKLRPLLCVWGILRASAFDFAIFAVGYWYRRYVCHRSMLE